MLPETLRAQLAELGITDMDEVALRLTLEAHVETYTLIKLAGWPARRWKCHYRLMLRDVMYDAQSVPEAYALALVAALRQPASQLQSSADQAETP
ncbi:MAG: hypothetical protein NVS2B12_30260 [Ktedonobacteraceae bacterium]